MKNLDVYKLGVVIEAAGAAKGISVIADADKKATKLGVSFDNLGKSAVRSFGDLKKSAAENATKTQQSLAAALLSGKKNIGGLIGEGKKAQSEFNALERAEAKALGMTSGGFFSRLSSRAGSVLPGLATVSSVIRGIPQVGGMIESLVSPLTDAAESGVRFNAFLETTQIAFENMLGSKEKATSFLKELRTFAGVSPFRTEGLVKTAQYMGAVGFQAKEVIPVLRDVGDAVAATGEISEESVQNIVRALGKMRGMGKVTAEEMESLADNGIPAWEMLAHAIGKTVEQTRKLAEQGRLRGGAAMEAIRAEMRARSGGMMDRLQSTYTGRKSAAEDAMQEAEAIATEPLFRDISRTYGAALSRADLVKNLAGTVSKAIAPVSGLVSAAAETLIGGGLTGGVVKGVDAGKALVASAVKDLSLDAMIGTAKKWLGIESPSKVFAELGGLSVDGLAFGKDGKGGLASEESKEKLRRALESLLGDPRVQAMLDTISHSEGAGYGTHVGHIGDRNPAGVRTKNRNVVYVGRDKNGKPLYSSADGRYQFINKTWDADAARIGLDDFTPYSQDLAAVFELMKSGAIDNLLVGDFAGAVHDARGVWASLPGAGYGQRERSLSSLSRVYGARLRALNGGTNMPPVQAAVAPITAAVPVIITNIQALSSRIGQVLSPEPSPAMAGVADTAPALQQLPIIARSLDETLAMIPPIAVPVAQGLQRVEVAAGSFANSVMDSAGRIDSLMGAFGQIAGMIPGQQVGRKRGFLSKVLGFAAPFLSFLPGGGILSALASIGSSALGGDYSGAISQTAAGFRSGGAFRSHASGSTQHRATGGPVRRGRAYVVGEYRNEIFEPNEDGWVHPSVESYLRSRGGRSRHEFFGHVRGELDEELRAHLAQLNQMMGALHQRISSMRPGDVVAIGARTPHGAQAVTDGWREHASRDPKVIEWMARRVNPQ